MKFKFVLCSIFVYGIIHVVADEEKDSYSASNEESVKKMIECGLSYLKSKGMIEGDTPSGEISTQCRLVISYFMRMLRNIHENMVKKAFPNEVDCLMDGFDKNRILDNAMKTEYLAKIENHKTSDGPSAAVKNKREQLKETANFCGLEGEKFIQVLNDSHQETSHDPEIAMCGTLCSSHGSYDSCANCLIEYSAKLNSNKI